MAPRCSWASMQLGVQADEAYSICGNKSAATLTGCRGVPLRAHLAAGYGARSVKEPRRIGANPSRISGIRPRALGDLVLKRVIAAIATSAATASILLVPAQPADAQGTNIYYDGILRASEFFWRDWTPNADERIRVSDEYVEGWGARGVYASNSGTRRFDNENGGGTDRYWTPNWPEGTLIGHQICFKNGDTTLACVDPIFEYA